MIRATRVMAITVLLLGITTVVAAAASDTKSACFFAHQFRTWKAQDDRTILIRVDPNRYYRLDLAASCATMRSPGSFLVTVFRGPNLVCNALDWNLTVKDNFRGPAEGCIVNKMTELSPDEAAAIPRKLRP